MTYSFVGSTTDMLFAKDLAAPNIRTGLSPSASNETFQDFEHTAITSRAQPPPISSNRSFSPEAEYLSMPGTTSSPSFLASLPSFMSVFGNGADVHRSMGGEALPIPSSNKPANVAKRPSPSSHFSSPIIRRDSASTFESADSSPTTTISTLDSALTEPSPSSSPESPTAQLPLSLLKLNLGSARGAMDPNDRPVNPLTALPGLNRADSPNKKMRNTKNLIVNTTASSRQRPSLPKLALSTSQPVADGHPFSAPPTPSFIVPPKPPRRRPSNLGLTLSTADAGIAGQPIQEGLGRVPQTPSERPIRTLNCARISANTPLFSPTVAPEGGMRLPPFGNSSIASRLGYHPRAPLTASYQPSYDNVNPSAITRQTLDHVQEEKDYELPLSREAKSPAYPQGPVCIYEPFVYLYLEPTETEAYDFDVVLNVAREVRNPFAATTNKQDISRSAHAAVQVALGAENRFFAGRGSISEPQTAISDEPFRPTFEVQLPDRTRDVHKTPKTLRPAPEYIHIPWDHNTNVVDDLLRLCELIDDRVRQEKRVLIHCQCGVSRSASLVVAYGLFKNPQLTVQDAYNIVKGHSRWIGPNMNLIYQLSEFKSKLLRGQGPSGPAWHSWRSMGPGRPNLHVGNPAASRSILSPGIMAAVQQDRSNVPFQAGQDPPPVRANSWTAPYTSDHGSSVPPLADHDPQPVRANSWATPHTAELLETSFASNVTSGPSSAPPDVQCYPSITGSPAAEDVVTADIRDQRPEIPPQPKEMDVDADLSTGTPADPGLGSDGSSPEPVPDVTPHALPAGFSSLSSRRQVPPKLPLRQDPPGFASRRPPRIAFDHPMDDRIPPSPSIMSPRAVEFTASPFHRTVAGDLAGSSVFEQGLMSPKPRQDDPRSPAQRGDASITRNIFGVL